MAKKFMTKRMMIMGLILMVAVFVVANMYIWRAHAEEKPVPTPEIRAEVKAPQAPAPKAKKPAKALVPAAVKPVVPPVPEASPVKK